MINVEEIQRYPIGKVRISAVRLQTAIACIRAHAKLNQPDYVCVSNTRAVSICSAKWDDYQDIQNNSLLSVPDGMPLVWIARCGGVKNIERITGYSLMIELLKHGHSHYFLGDTRGTLDALKRRIQDNYPKAQIVGTYSPPFRDLTEEEVKRCAVRINQLKPDFIWIGLGAPKQERFIVRVMPYLKSGILLGVGAAFRLLIDEYKTVHPILQKMGLEGFFWRLGKVSLTKYIVGYSRMSIFVLVNILKALINKACAQ